MVRTGLERHIHRGSARPVPGLLQGLRFGVKFPGTAMKSPPDHGAIGHHQASDAGIGGCGIAASFRQFQGFFHEARVRLLHRHGGGRSSGVSSLVNKSICLRLADSGSALASRSSNCRHCSIVVISSNTEAYRMQAI